MVGVTPDGRRHPLFVGTIGEVRSFADAARQAGGVVDGTWYQTIRWSEAAMPADSMAFTAEPAAPKPGAPPQTSAVKAPPTHRKKQRDQRAPQKPPNPDPKPAPTAENDTGI